MQGRVVIVTGGAKGIGRYAAHTLAKAGAKVVLADADVERIHKTLGEIHRLNAEALAIPTDVRDEKDVRRMVHEVVDHFGQIDALIAAAYVVSKDAIRTFTRFVAEEEREWNVGVVAFSPKQAIATEDAPEEARKRLPGPEILGNGFVLAAQAGMELTGKTVEHRNGKLVVAD